MVDALDEYVVDQMKEFERNNLISSTKESLKFDESGNGMVSKNQTGFLLIDEGNNSVSAGRLITLDQSLRREHSL